MKSPRIRAIVSIALALAVVLIGWSQVWFSIVVDGTTIDIPGASASGAVLALTLAGAALTAAIALVGPKLRIAFAILLIAAGVVITVISIAVIADPAPVFASVIAADTGLGGDAAIDSIESAQASAWPILCAIGGVAAAIFGFVVARTSRRWPAVGRRYERSAKGSTDSAVDRWDALSEGEDPTADDR